MKLFPSHRSPAEIYESLLALQFLAHLWSSMTGLPFFFSFLLSHPLRGKTAIDYSKELCGGSAGIATELEEKN